MNNKDLSVDDGGAPLDYLPIATIDRHRGLTGEVVVTVHADDPDRMARLARVFMKEGTGYRPLEVQEYKRLGSRAVVRLEGVATVEAARALVGRDLLIPRKASTPPPEGRYYAHQLEGLTARLKDGTLVGEVREVMTPGAQSLLLVSGPAGEILVPLVKAICVDIDLDRRIVTLDPPEGLLELNRQNPARG